jgi:hypothetical protein
MSDEMGDEVKDVEDGVVTRIEPYREAMTTPEMRKQLTEDGIEGPDQAKLLDMSTKLNTWIEAHRHNQNKRADCSGVKPRVLHVAQPAAPRLALLDGARSSLCVCRTFALVVQPVF